MVFREVSVKPVNKDSKLVKTMKGTDLPKEGIKGTYKGTETFQSKFGVQTVHKIGDIKVYGATDLNRKLGLVSEGTEVLVKFKGRKALKNGRSMNEFSVMTEE